jgi:hypothetical protein
MSLLLHLDDPALAARANSALDGVARCAAVSKSVLAVVDGRSASRLTELRPDLSLAFVDASPRTQVDLLASCPSLTGIATPDSLEEPGLRRALRRTVRRALDPRCPLIGNRGSALCEFVGSRYPGDPRVGVNALGQNVRGRRAFLYSSEAVEARLDRFEQFADGLGAGSRTIAIMRDLATELISNAMYDAPFESGRIPGPVPRTAVVELPADQPVEVSYGVSSELLFFSVRDPYGSFRRERLMQVLSRCAGDDGDTLDESRGGAGLGLWRVFSKSSLFVCAVEPNLSTEMLVALPLSGGRLRTAKLVFLLFGQERPVMDSFVFGAPGADEGIEAAR